MSAVQSSKRDDKNIVVSFDSDSEESSSSDESADDAPRQQPSTKSQPTQPPSNADKPLTNSNAAPNSTPQPSKSRAPAGSSSESDDNGPSTNSVKQPQKQQSPPPPAAAAQQKPAVAAARSSKTVQSDQSSSDDESDVPATKTNHQKPNNSTAIPAAEIQVPPATKPAPSDDPKPAKTVKKKASSSKTENTAVNGDDQSSAAVDQVKETKPQTIESPGEPAAPAKKKVTKTTKKSSKSAESVENGVADEPATKIKETSQTQAVDKASDVINTKPETEDVKPASAEIASSAPAATTTKKKVVKKPKASSMVPTSNGNVDNVNNGDDAIDKIPDGKDNKKPTATDTNGMANVADASVKSEAALITPEAETPKKPEEKVSAEPDVKEKLKKKRDSVGETSGEGASKAADASDGTAAKKVVKRKVKKVASTADSTLPAEENAAASTTSKAPTESTVVNNQTIQDDIEADREVMMICDVKPVEIRANDEISRSEPTATTAPQAACVEDIATVLEVSISQPNIDLNLNQEKLETGNINAPNAVPGIGGTLPTDENQVSAVLSSADSGIKTDSEGQVKSLENEESDYTYRRKSMDDFIKRILAEAREEQQKRTSSSLTTAADDPLLPPTKQKDDVSLEITTDEDQTADKIQSMLDRRLASTDRKRLQADHDLDNNIGSINKKTGLLTDLDIDDDLADIKGYFTKRNQNSKLDSTGLDLGLDDDTNLRTRASTRIDLLGADDGLGISQKILKDVLSEDSNSYLTRIRQQQQSGTETLFGEDSFAPRRRDETADLVRTSSRPVRALIDQQTDVIQQLKATTRNIDDLETEIRNLRETFLDRQARIDSLRNAIDAETRVYETEQHATNERLKQQRIPGGNFVREEFMTSLNIGTASSRLHSAAAAGTSLDLGFRSRSGSMSSASGLDLSMLSATRATSLRPSAVDIGLRRQSAASDVDDSTSVSALSTTGYTPSKYRRGGSVARERTYNMDDLLGGGGGTTSDSAGTTWTSRTTTTTSSSGLPSFDVTSSYEPSRYQYDSTSSSDYYRTPTSYSTRSSLYSGSSALQSRDPGRYSSSRFSDSSDLSGGSGGLDTSRFRRAQSVFDVSTPSYDSNSATSTGGYSFVSTRYSGGAGSDSASGRSGGEFQSKFLDKVRGNRSGLSDDSSRSGSSGFKSRFLRSNYDSSSSNRY